MKKLIKISAIIIILLQIMLIPTSVRADDVITPADDFLSKGKELMHGDVGEEEVNTLGLNEVGLRDTNAKIFNLLFAGGVVLAVIIGGVLGIKFLVSSAEEKAQVKELMIPYVLGCVVIFGAFTIWKIVVTILQQVE